MMGPSPQIFFLLSLVQTLSVACVSIIGAYGSSNASLNLHQALLRSVIFSPMAFFDATPLGRLGACSSQVACPSPGLLLAPPLTHLSHPCGGAWPP
jgi:hypothetical protein